MADLPEDRARGDRRAGSAASVSGSSVSGSSVGSESVGSASVSAARIGRRRLLKAAVFPPQSDQPGQSGQSGQSDPGQPGPGQPDPGQPGPGQPDLGQRPRSVAGTIIDVSPQVLVIADSQGEQRFTLTPDAIAWRGGPLDPAALRPGEQAVIRLHPARRSVADRIWASIGRVTGTIIEHGRDGLVIDQGTQNLQRVIIPARAASRIQVRFPTLEPGYLVDVIGIRRDGMLEALIPATSQPVYRSDRLPPPPLVSGRVPDTISGSATWHDPADEPPGALGVAYPAIDPETGRAPGAASSGPLGFARLPYLAVGSVLLVRNDCTGSSCALPVTGCAPVARLFNDRCVTCGTSPRGRVADLTLASFVALGGELERGCFNATITIGR